MAALGVDVSKAKLMIGKVLSSANVSEGLWIAAVNSVNAVTVSGYEYLIEAIVALAATPTAKVFAAKLRVTCAFHSPLMETQEATLKSLMKSALANGTGASSPTARVMSSVDGNWLQRDMDADYCWDNIRRPVLFGAGISRIVNHCKVSNQKAIFLEIAPHPVLRSYIEEGGGMPISLATRPNPKVSVQATGNHQQFLEGLGNLIGAGYKGVDFDRFYASPHGHQGYVKINFPSYPYNKIICWSESGAARSIRLQQPTSPLSGSHFRLSVDTHPELTGHHIFNTPLFPASG
jgi:acyl transferase domain-containing protein